MLARSTQVLTCIKPNDNKVIEPFIDWIYVSIEMINLWDVRRDVAISACCLPHGAFSDWKSVLDNVHCIFRYHYKKMVHYIVNRAWVILMLFVVTVFPICHYIRTEDLTLITYFLQYVYWQIDCVHMALCMEVVLAFRYNTMLVTVYFTFLICRQLF